jgi:hypothetical protein
MPRQILDTAEHWFLESLLYRDGTLEVRLAAGILSEVHDIEVLGVSAGPGRSITVEALSRRLAVRFRGVAAYQVYSESFSRPDRYEPAATGVFREHAKSEYLECLESSTHFPLSRPRSYRHFSLALEDEILDVVAEEEPEFEEIEESVLGADA